MSDRPAGGWAIPGAAPMMFGYSDGWWLLLLYPALLWVPFGPFAMVSLGVWCASAPGRRPRLWSVLVPLIPVVTSAIFMVFPLSQWDRPVRVDGAKDPPAQLDDFLGYLAVYVGGITVLPWLLGYGGTRLMRFIRNLRRGPGKARRARNTATEADTV
ncbi:hypothetical protein ACFYOV_29600 [Streptomyces sp. NPDC005931]|uniref:hypothetical protein n=1 Tax=Streptomyces sp. NPDC005931 TaxID=3364737 RepID=UPI003674B2A0